MKWTYILGKTGLKCQGEADEQKEDKKQAEGKR